MKAGRDAAKTPSENTLVRTGIAGLDEVLHGGLRTGLLYLAEGTAGTGKTTLGLQFALEGVRRGESVLYVTLAESQSDLARVAQSHGWSLEKMHIMVIDSLNGYLQAMPDQRFLLTQMHELLVYLGQQGVATFLVMGQSGTIGDTYSPANASYLTDNIILLRFFEAAGEVRKAISVVKRRRGAHEATIRELTFGPAGIVIGEALRQFQGIFSGEPTFTGAAGQLMQAQDDQRRRTAKE